MSSNDAMSESKLWNDTAPATNEQSIPGRANHTNNKTSRTALNHTQPEAMKQGAGRVVKQESTEISSPPPLQPPHVSTDPQAAAEHSDQEPVGITFEHPSLQVTPPLLLEGIWQSQDAASETHLKSSSPLPIGSALTTITAPNHHPTLPIPTSRGIEDSCPTEPTLHRGDCIHKETAPHEQVSEVEKAFPKTSESLGPNLYMLSTSRNAQPQESIEMMTGSIAPNIAGAKEQRHILTKGTDDEFRMHVRSGTQSKLMGDGHQSSRATVSKHPPLENQYLDHGEAGDELLSSDGDFVAASDDWDSDESEDIEDADADEHVANVDSKLQRSAAKAEFTWKQRHKIFQVDGLEFQTPAREDDNADDTYNQEQNNFRTVKKIKNDPASKGHTASRYSQQNSARASSARAPGVRPPQTGVKTHQYGGLFDPSNPHSQEIALNLYPECSRMSDPASLPYGMYQSGMQHPQQGPSYGQHAVGYQNFGYPAMPLDRYPSHIRHPPLPISPFQIPVRHLAPPAPNSQSLKYQALPAQPRVQYQNALQSQLVGEADDDDEPLRTRVRHQLPSIHDSASRSSSPAFEPAQLRNKLDHAKDPESKVVESHKKQPLNKGTAVRKAPSTQPAVPQCAQFQVPTQSESAPASEIDWKLPEYEAIYTPAPTKHDPGLAKVSLPGLVREEILLSPDHAEQEAHLLLNIFIPAQKALQTPDPMPAVAVLNFHTIAVMVIEAFVQFEIGDEFGTGRGHLHHDHDTEDGEYERLRSAKDSDEDEIFFSVIDRWRAAMESGKEPAKLVRGAQEFCDIALEVIYYIKEHGLLAQRERAVRSDKGVKRGARKVGEVEEEKTGAKRKLKVNDVPARKKAKAEKPKAKAPAKRKSRAKEPALTVVKAPPRGK
jgi:hypothetical protein